LNFEAEMLRSSDRLGASVKVALIFSCIFLSGAFALTSPLKWSYHVLTENKCVNTKATPEIVGKKLCLHARAMGMGTLYLIT